MTAVTIFIIRHVSEFAICCWRQHCFLRRTSSPVTACFKCCRDLSQRRQSKRVHRVFFSFFSVVLNTLKMGEPSLPSAATASHLLLLPSQSANAPVPVAHRHSSNWGDLALTLVSLAEFAFMSFPSIMACPVLSVFIPSRNNGKKQWEYFFHLFPQRNTLPVCSALKTGSDSKMKL